MIIKNLEQITSIIAALLEMKDNFLGELLLTIAKKEFIDSLFDTDDPVVYDIQPMSLIQRALYTIIKTYCKRLDRIEDKMGDDCVEDAEYQKLLARQALAGHWLYNDLEEVARNHPKKVRRGDHIMPAKSFRVVGIPQGSSLHVDLFGEDDGDEDDTGSKPKNTFQGIECVNKISA